MPVILFPLRTYQIALFLLFIALLGTFYHRAEHFDDAWFAEQSFWLVKDGKVRSELFRGYNGWENRIYVFHKLFIYAGALIMSVGGFSVAVSKLIGILFGGLGGWLIWQYSARFSRETQWLSLGLYVGCGALIRHICVNRPEFMCMALGLLSYLAIDRSPTKQPMPVLAGVFAGLAALTHLNGVIYLLAGFGLLFTQRKWQAVFSFGLASGLTLSFYLLDAVLDGSLDVMLMQFRSDPATQQNLNWLDKLSVMANYHQIFFHNHNEFALTVLFLLCLIAFRRRIQRSEPVFVYTLFLFFSFWVLTKSATYLYFILFLPWLVMLTANWAIRYLPEQPGWQRKTARVLLALYGVVAIFQIGNTIIENRTLPDVDTQNALLAKHMPRQHTNVIAPIEFFFGQIENYRIRGLTYYYLLQQKQGTITLPALFQLAEQEDVEYVISDHRLNGSYDIPPGAPARIGAYQRVYQDKWNSIYTRQRTKP